MLSGMVVEANLPSTILDQYDVVLDYGDQALTLAPPGTHGMPGEIHKLVLERNGKSFIVNARVIRF